MNLYSFLIFGFISFHTTSAAGRCSRSSLEREEEEVKLTFYNMAASDWKKAKDDFASELAKKANKFCDDKPSKCGLQNSNSGNFAANLVGFTDETPKVDKDDKYSMYVYVYLKYSDSMTLDGATQCVVPASGVKAIVTKYRVDIGSETGYHIVGIGSEVYSIPPDSRLNAILIPLAFVVLLIVVVVAISCYCWKARLDKLARRHQHREKIIKRFSKVVAKAHQNRHSNQHGTRQEKIAKHNKEKERLAQGKQKRASKVPPPPEDIGAAVYQPPEADDRRHSYSTKEPETEPDSGTKPVGDSPHYEAPPANVFHVSEASAAVNNLDETSERKVKKKHKKHKKHKRRHDEPERDGEGEKQYNITADTSMRMTGTDSDAEERF